MKHLVYFAAFAVLISGSSGALAQNNNANSNAPGQDRVCLVETSVPGRFNNDDVVSTKWLPRKAAEAQASKSPSTLMIFDGYASEPEVIDGTYDDAEDFCENYFIDN